MSHAYTWLQGRLARQTLVFALGVGTHHEESEHNMEMCLGDSRVNNATTETEEENQECGITEAKGNMFQMPQRVLALAY